MCRMSLWKRTRNRIALHVLLHIFMWRLIYSEAAQQLYRARPVVSDLFVDGKSVCNLRAVCDSLHDKSESSAVFHGLGATLGLVCRTRSISVQCYYDIYQGRLTWEHWVRCISNKYHFSFVKGREGVSEEKGPTLNICCFAEIAERISMSKARLSTAKRCPTRL